MTALSMLARLGLDPRQEASDLAKLPVAAARARLDRTIANFGDVPSLAERHGAITERLISLLPRAATRADAAGRGLSSGPRPTVSRTPIYLIILVVLIVAAVRLFNGPNLGG